MAQMTIRTRDSSELIFEDVPRYDPWLKFLLYSIPSVAFIFGVIALSRGSRDDGLASMGMAVFYALLLYVILPHRYQVFPDRIVIVLGRPFAFRVPLNTVREVGEVSGGKAFFYGGIRWVTSTKTVMEIRRSRGMNVVISPLRRDLFLEQVNQLLRERAAGKKKGSL